MMFLIIDFYVFCIFPELCIITVYTAEMFWKLDIKMFILAYSLLSGASNEQIVSICPHQAPCSWVVTRIYLKSSFCISFCKPLITILKVTKYFTKLLNFCCPLTILHPLSHAIAKFQDFCLFLLSTVAVSSFKQGCPLPPPTKQQHTTCSLTAQTLSKKSSSSSPGHNLTNYKRGLEDHRKTFSCYYSTLLFSPLRSENMGQDQDLPLFPPAVFLIIPHTFLLSRAVSRGLIIRQYRG